MTVIMGSELSAMAAANFAAMGSEMVTIPGATTFMMGSLKGYANERPVHPVTVGTFQMGRNPITNEKYGPFVDFLGNKRFVRIGLDPRTGLERVFALGDDEGKIDRLTAERLIGEEVGSAATKGGVMTFADSYAVACMDVMRSFRTARISDHRPPRGFDAQRQPVIEVNWNEALAFANLNGVRLPTEAEWECAARVRPDGGLRTYATPNDDVDETHYSRDIPPTSTIDVDDPRYPSLPNGLRHMSGNVWEWAQDWYGIYSEGPVNNPAGPLSGQFRVLRGGSWFNLPQFLRAAGRGGGDTGDRYNFIGFRCASSPRTT